jgi:hypothetical protein
MLRLGGVASRTYLVAFPAIKEHFQQQGLELDWVLYSSWDALVEAFVRREVDVAWNGPLAYVKIKRRLGDPCQVVAMRDIDVNLLSPTSKNRMKLIDHRSPFSFKMNSPHDLQSQYLHR